MKIKIKIDKDNGVPAYRQIIEQITTLIRDGKLTAGDRLPPERELAVTLGIARGTVKNAYEKLASSNVIEISQGRGSFISSGQYVMAEGRKAKAVKIIGDAISSLDKLKFGSREISSMFHILLAELEQKKASIHLAGIDCNPEALSIFDRQLRYISNIQLYHFLLDDISRDSDIRNKLHEFDLILTTSTHYAELIGLFPELREKIMKAIVSPSQQTIIDLARIPASSSVGIVTHSRNFLKIIRNKLDEFQIRPKNIKHLFDNDLDKFSDFIRRNDVLITPPECAIEERKEFQIPFQQFRENGGTIIRFDYQIERSSLLQIEERISKLIKNMKP